MKSTTRFTPWTCPITRLGRSAVALMMVFIVMFLLNGVLMQFGGGGWFQQNILPFYGILMVIFGLTSGIVGLVAILRVHERSWLVWLTLLPLAMMVVLLLGEFLGGAH